MVSNPLSDDPAREHRIRERAYHLWEAGGRVHGRDAEYWERARELVGMEESAGSGLLDNPETHPNTLTGFPPGVEEAEIQDNLGEFPNRMTDEGDRRGTPMSRRGVGAEGVSSPPVIEPPKAAASKATSRRAGKPKPNSSGAGKSP